jgi:mRNA interferase MazF
MAGARSIEGWMEVSRGDIVTVVLPGAYGKPRPALVVQSNLFSEHPSITILPVTSELRNTPLFRITVDSDAQNGLIKQSQIMVDKAQTIPRDKIGRKLGRLDEATIMAVNRALALFLGFA